MPARREALLAGAVAVSVLVIAMWHDVTIREALPAAALCLPLAWRTRWPLGVLVAVGVGAATYLTLAPDPTPAYIPATLVAVATVAALGSRWRTLAVMAALLPFAVLVVVLASPDEGSDLRQLLELVTQLGLAAAVGEAVRSQRAYVQAARERARMVEHEYELEAARRVDEERVRIARDVHDIVAHSLATISTQASVGAHVGRQDPATAVDALDAIKGVSAGALEDLRSALGALRADAPTHPAPGLQDLPELVDGARSSGQPVVLHMQGSPAALPAGLQVAVYRIVQEGLTNVIRHAGGAQATVRVAVTPSQVEVDVSDDGAGAPTAASGAGSRSGLIGMQERATALGGALHAGRETGGGFGVHAVIPVHRTPS